MYLLQIDKISNSICTLKTISLTLFVKLSKRKEEIELSYYSLPSCLSRSNITIQ